MLIWEECFLSEWCTTYTSTTTYLCLKLLYYWLCNSFSADLIYILNRWLDVYYTSAVSMVHCLPNSDYKPNSTFWLQTLWHLLYARDSSRVYMWVWDCTSVVCFGCCLASFVRMRGPLHVSESELLAAGAAWKGKVSIKTTWLLSSKIVCINSTHVIRNKHRTQTKSYPCCEQARYERC